MIDYTDSVLLCPALVVNVVCRRLLRCTISNYNAPLSSAVSSVKEPGHDKVDTIDLTIPSSKGSFG